MRLLGFIPVLLMACGCRSQIPPQASATKSVTDSVGRVVAVPYPPQRIVSVAPTHTETLFALGLADRVVGVTEYCNHPVAAKSKPKVGQFLPATISLETIVSLKPDVVLTDTGVQGPLIASLERLGIATVAIEAKSWTQVRAGITTIGELAGVPDRAKELNDGITKRAEAIRERVRTRPRVRVFFLINEQPLMTVGPKTFLSESLTMAGGINVFEDVGQDYPTVSDEELIRREPEVILVSRSGETAAKRQELLARSSWRNLPAVRSGRIVFVDEDLVSRAGPRLAEGLDAIAAAIHGP